MRSYIPFQIRKSNIPLILSENFAEMFASRSAAGGHYTSISLGCATQILDGLQYVIEYQGDQSPKLVLGHVMQHLKKVPKYYVRRKIFVVMLIVESGELEAVRKDIGSFRNCLNFIIPENRQMPSLIYAMNHLKTSLNRKLHKL